MFISIEVINLLKENLIVWSRLLGRHYSFFIITNLVFNHLNVLIVEGFIFLFPWLNLFNDKEDVIVVLVHTSEKYINPLP